MNAQQFDPGLIHAYLVEAVRKIGSTLSNEEIVANLQRRYQVTRYLALKAIDYANS